MKAEEKLVAIRGPRDADTDKGGDTMKGRIEIQSLEDGIKDFRTAWKAAAAELLRAIRRDRPASISQLAQLLGRDFKNVHTDIQTLARYELVSLTTSRAGRPTTSPRVPFSVLEFRIAV